MSALLDVKNLTVTFQQYKKSVTLVDNVSFSVEPGQCLGILGESGSGKSMTCKSIMGLLDDGFKTAGEAIFGGKNLLKLPSEDMRRLRGKEICMILQNPMTCFDPLYCIGDQMSETFSEHLTLTRREIRTKSLNTLALMQIKNPEDVLAKYPHQLSGGMLQRIMIGLALAANPRLIIADEPTTAIDTITQAEIIKEFLKIKDKHDTALIFISHDLGVISKLSDKVVVMHCAKAVQTGTLHEVFCNPADSYTKTLVDKKLAVMKQFNKIINKSNEVPI